MSAEIRALAAEFPSEVPTEHFDYLIGVLLTKGATFDRFKAAKAAYDIAGYLLGRFFGVATAETVAKPKKVSKKQIAETLKALQSGGEVSVKAFPAWLIPILLDLAKTWLEKKK